MEDRKEVPDKRYILERKKKLEEINNEITKI